jgi:putative addiction module component (TIGR02574 family)
VRKIAYARQLILSCRAPNTRLASNGLVRIILLNMTLDEMPEIQQLTKEEKLQLVEDLWDAIAAMPDDLPVSAEEKALLEKRFKAHCESPEDALTLDDFEKRLAERL